MTELSSKKAILTSLSWAKADKAVILNWLENKPISKFEKTDSDKLNHALRTISKYSLGIHEDIPIEALALINTFLNKYYSDLTLQDIITAFEQFCMGTLGELKHFGIFSVDFVSKVLNRYCRNRDEVIRAFKIAQESKQRQISEPPISDEQFNEYLDKLAAMNIYIKSPDKPQQKITKRSLRQFFQETKHRK